MFVVDQLAADRQYSIKRNSKKIKDKLHLLVHMFSIDSHSSLHCIAYDIYQLHEIMSKLFVFLRSKCDQDTCASLESCLIDPRGNTCTDTFGSAVAPYGLVSALPSLQTWVDTIKDGIF